MPFAILCACSNISWCWLFEVDCSRCQASSIRTVIPLYHNAIIESKLVESGHLNQLPLSCGPNISISSPLVDSRQIDSLPEHLQSLIQLAWWRSQRSSLVVRQPSFGIDGNLRASASKATRWLFGKTWFDSKSLKRLHIMICFLHQSPQMRL